MAVSLELLTDDAILDYTRSEGREHIITDYHDISLNYDNKISPIPGGIYDVDIFGSPMIDRCICGHLRQPSSTPCPCCGARVYTREEGLRRFARIELPFYYLNDLRFDIFKTFFDDVFSDVTINQDFISDLKTAGYSTAKGGKKLGIKVFDSCQFNYDAKKKELTISEKIDDESKCSYEGIMDIIKNHYPDRLTEYMKLINHYYLVQPIAMRPFSIANKGGHKTLGVHDLSQWYSAVVQFCCVEATDSNRVNYADVMKALKTPGERVRYTSCVRAFLNAGKKEATELLNSSKENLARGLYSVRTKNSARCPIVPDMELAIDEVGVPRSLAYEMCREGFIGYIQEKLNFTKLQATKATRYEAMNEETQKLFKEYAESQCVIANRQPSLHEYSMFCLKMKLVDDYAIHYPPSLCEPLNADFDGDTIALQLVPEDAKDDTYRKMSPRYVTYYKKNMQPIAAINHENLNGLALATEWVYDDPEHAEEERKDPKHYYDDYVQLLKDVEVDRKIKVGTPIVFNGNVDKIKFKSKITTYGKVRISKILERDMDDLMDQVGVKNIYQRYNAKNAVLLSKYLGDLEDGVEKRLELQKFCLRVVSLAGVVTFDFKTLFVDCMNRESYKELCRIADSKELTDQQKLALLTTKYDEFEKEVEADFSEDLKNELNRSARVKLNSISALNMPQLIISGKDENPVITRGNLLSGYTEKDMIYHSIENRSIQAIRQSGVQNYSCTYIL